MGPLKDGQAAGPFTSQDKFFQSKSRVNGMDSFRISTKTHDVKEIKGGRSQNLRNCETKGRPFDIISGAGYEYMGPSIPATLEPKHLRQSHPSLCTRAGSGNL